MPKPKPWPSVPTSTLTRRRWPVDGLGMLRLAGASPQLWKEFDRTWPELRPRSDDVSWSWYAVGAKTPERWTVTVDFKPVAAFAAGPKLLKLPDGLTFRLDFLEARGDIRRKSIGALSMVLIAKRALEAGAARLVLSALPRPDALSLYDKTGGQRVTSQGWSPASGLIPFTWEPDALKALARRLDDVEEEDQSEGSG